jgi:hypothetical protein
MWCYREFIGGISFIRYPERPYVSFNLLSFCHFDHRVKSISAYSLLIYNPNQAIQFIATPMLGALLTYCFNLALVPSGREALSSGIALLLSCFPRPWCCLKAPQQIKGA